ncbi:MAG: ATP synthase subunit I [Prochloraceae cyanobacterium]|nr:ATP synthase subunit I [Prochloraceae cyanobacterium]
MSQSNQSLANNPADPTTNVDGIDSSTTENNSMEEYYQLQKTLRIVTLCLMVIIFFPVWIFYSLNTALNYVLGASVGVVYLRMLGTDVEKLGKEKSSLGSRRLGLFALMIIVATQWQQLNVLPVFLGFLTYKAAIVVYTIQSFTSIRE